MVACHVEIRAHVGSQKDVVVQHGFGIGDEMGFHTGIGCVGVRCSGCLGFIFVLRGSDPTGGSPQVVPDVPSIIVPFLAMRCQTGLALVMVSKVPGTGFGKFRCVRIDPVCGPLGDIVQLYPVEGVAFHQVFQGNRYFRQNPAKGDHRSLRSTVPYLHPPVGQDGDVLKHASVRDLLRSGYRLGVQQFFTESRQIRHRNGRQATFRSIGQHPDRIIPPAEKDHFQLAAGRQHVDVLAPNRIAFRAELEHPHIVQFRGRPPGTHRRTRVGLFG